MTLQQLRYIIGIVAHGSMSEGAKRMFISQPSLSIAVKELEEEMGIRIFRRSSRGISLTPEGSEFLSYARQVIEQAELLEERYLTQKPARRIFSLSTQHYDFAVKAFVNLLKDLDMEQFEWTIRETRTHEIIDDVAQRRSDLGLLYLNGFNRDVILSILQRHRLQFHPLFCAPPHVFISDRHPLSGEKSISLNELEPYPCLRFEQGEHNSFYFSEEILSTTPHSREIHVSDRATLFNLLLGLNGYTICTGILSKELNSGNIISIPLQADDEIRVGWIQNEDAPLGKIALRYLRELRHVIAEYGYSAIPDDPGDPV